MSQNNIGIFNENRCRIFNYIMENPGRHFSEIMRELGLTKRGLGYHLEKMTKEGIIISQSTGFFKYYYPLGSRVESKNITPAQEKVIDILREKPASTKELADTMKKSPRSVDYHLKNLREKGFVAVRKVGNKSVWYVE